MLQNTGGTYEIASDKGDETVCMFDTFKSRPGLNS